MTLYQVPFYESDNVTHIFDSLQLHISVTGEDYFTYLFIYLFSKISSTVWETIGEGKV